MKSRRFFLTIHKGASCFRNFESLVAKADCEYYYILHGSDEETSGDHYHCILVFKNPRSYEALCMHYNGAHVERCKFFHQTLKYLIHLGYEYKVHYLPDDIITNVERNRLDQYLTEDEYSELTIEQLEHDVESGAVKTFADCCKKYGLHQCRTYFNVVNALLKEYGL